MLETTVVLEAVLGKWLEAGIIGGVLLFNAALGFVQEGRAGSAIELLRSRLHVTARVRRDGRWQMVPAAELVPGDLVHVRVGDLVPADLKVHTGHVRIDQSVLTGESQAVTRTAGQAAYAGSTVIQGEADAQITATGANSYFGRTAELVRTAGVAGHTDRVVLRMVRVFIIMDLIIAAAGTAWLTRSGTAPEEIVSFTVVLLLASVPVALPAAFALAGALGAQRLAHRGILTARLSAVQDAATMDVLCVDKTGTLTQNRLAVTDLTVRAGADRARVLQLAAEASDEATQDPIDLAVIAAARAEGAAAARPRLDFEPFDPSTKRSTATVRTAAGTARVTKGAPHVIAALAAEPINPQVEHLAGTGARVLAVAETDQDGDWHPTGLIALSDPPRPDAGELVERLSKLGVRIVMLTGDSLATARAVAAQVGIDGAAITAGALAEPGDHPDGPDGPDVGVVAEVLPEDKHRIVDRLQDTGHVVGMTGDGVNDAPALRQAELGIAVAGATDVAKSAAAVVLTRPGLADIADLVIESRRDHQRSVTYALNVAVKKFELPLLLAMGVFAWNEFVFTPLLMALLLLGNDVASMAIVTDRADYARRPDTWDVRKLILGALTLAIPLLLVSAGILWTARDAWPALGLDQLRTVAFLTLITSSQAGIYLARTRGHLWSTRPGTGVLAATATDITAATVLALTGTLMDPVTPATALVVIGTVLAATGLIDMIKVPAFRALGIHHT